jgi:hypothetical protein
MTVGKFLSHNPGSGPRQSAQTFRYAVPRIPSDPLGCQVAHHSSDLEFGGDEVKARLCPKTKPADFGHSVAPTGSIPTPSSKQDYSASALSSENGLPEAGWHRGQQLLPVGARGELSQHGIEETPARQVGTVGQGANFGLRNLRL